MFSVRPSAPVPVTKKPSGVVSANKDPVTSVPRVPAAELRRMGTMPMESVSFAATAVRSR